MAEKVVISLILGEMLWGAVDGILLYCWTTFKNSRTVKIPSVFNQGYWNLAYFVSEGGRLFNKNKAHFLRWVLTSG